MAKRKLYGSTLVKRLETLGGMLDTERMHVTDWQKQLSPDKREMMDALKIDRRKTRIYLAEHKRAVDALTFALDVINDLLPTKVAYEAWGGKLLELSLNHSEDKDGRLLVYATLVDYTACEKPPHEDRVHVMRIDSATRLGTHEPRTADNALWLDMIAGMAECGVFGVVETVREPKALLTAGTEVSNG